LPKQGNPHLGSVGVYPFFKNLQQGTPGSIAAQNLYSRKVGDADVFFVGLHHESPSAHLMAEGN